MKNIIIIADGKVEQEAIGDILLQHTGEYELSFAHYQQAAAIIKEKVNPDLIIYDLESFEDGQVNNLARLTASFSYIPSIAIIDEKGEQAETVLKSGVSQCLARPLNADDLQRHIGEQLELAISGRIRGIPVHSLLQMLESEGKTCSLKIQSKGRTGMIFIDRGTIIGAETADLEDEGAVHALITWEDPAVEIRYYNGMRPQTIDKPLISLIMEGFRLKNDEERLIEEQESQHPTRLDQKILPTEGSRLPLEIGTRIKMEVEGMDTELVSTMVGMVPDGYIIITTPPPFSVVRNALAAGGPIIIKYLHLGRLCMFTTRLLNTVESPQHLLFLAYPPVIHYHELRRSKRTSMFIPCTFHLPMIPEFYGILVDLSGLGCLCQIKTRGNAPLPPIDINTEVHLHCLLPGLKEDQELSGVVKNIKRCSAETRIGIEFVGLQDYLREVIEKYVYSVESITG